MKWPVIFALATALCWGMYGPMLGKSRAALGNHPFMPFVAIGIAYLVWGVGGGLIGMKFNNEPFAFNGQGSMWGFVAGTLGAWGAFSLTLAMFATKPPLPHIVMPIVFGGAVAVSALYSIYKLGSNVSVSPMLYVGIVGMIICIGIVASNTPHGAPHKPSAAAPAGEAPGDAVH